MLFLIIVSVFSCEYMDTTNPRSSKSIKDSKKQKLFITEFKPFNSQINEEQIEFEIVESWTENIWFNDNLFGAKTILPDTQLVVLVRNLSFSEYNLIEPINKLSYTNKDGGKITFRRSKILDKMEIKLINDKRIVLTKS